MASRLSRAQREVLDREDAPYLKQPLVLGRDPRSARAHLRQMVKLLGSTRSASPCSDAVAYLTGLFERTAAELVPPQAQKLIACARGCAHCCVQPVGITAAEAFFVARQIKDRVEIVAAMRQAGEKIRQTPKDQRLFQMRCPILVDNECGAYDARPLSCHTFVSFNVNACIAKYVLLGPSNIQMPAEQGPIGNACRMLLFAALGLAGRRDHTTTFEMKAAVAAILDMDDGAEARWLKGENVLAAVDPLPPIEPMFDWSIREMITAVGPAI